MIILSDGGKRKIEPGVNQMLTRKGILGLDSWLNMEILNALALDNWEIVGRPKVDRFLSGKSIKISKTIFNERLRK